MAGRRKHAAYGAGVGAGVGIAAALIMAKITGQPITFGGVAQYAAGGALLGVAGAMIPDLLEPATSPNHRGGWHTAEAGAALALATGITLTQPQLFVPVLTLGVPAVAGYNSHLFLDSKTPQGLPKLRKGD